MPTFRYPADLVSRVRAEWGAFTWRGVEVDPLPADDVLLPLLETCYFASLTAEESRPTRFSAFVGDPESAPDSLLLEKEVPITVEAIRRIAPAVTSQRLGIRLRSRFEECTFWGFAPASRNHGLQIDVYGPGRVFVGNPLTSWLGLDGGRLDSGVGVIADDILFAVFGRAFSEFMARVPDPINEALYKTPFRTWMAMLLTGASEHGHGGAIFVVPEAEADGRWRSLARVKYPCDHPAIIERMLELAEQKGNDHLGAFHRIEAEIRRVAALSQVDGAVVVTDSFQVLGFGVEFTAPPMGPEAESILRNGRAHLIEEYGTRHRSAFRLVAACPYVTAFVCSQDGGLKCIRHEAGGVVLHA